MAVTIQAGVTQVINLNTGSVILAFIESVRDVAMWLQSIVMQLLMASRLSTATKTDVDSFVADFGLTRIAAVSSTGAVTFARTTTTQQAIIPLLTQIKTSDGTQTFNVVADTAQASWSVSANAYLIPIGTASITATVLAVNGGIQGNVLANTITTLTQPIQGVQTVTNGLPFANGIDQEIDPALKARFPLYISGLRAGIKPALASAIANLQQGIQYSLTENQNYAGATQLGYFYVVINPSTSALQTSVYSAVDAIRPLSSSFGVFPATTVTANISMTATALAGYTHAQIVTSITAAVQAFILTLGLGKPLYWSQLYAVVYAVAGVQEVTLMTINSGTVDLSATAQQVIVTGTVVVN